jgi:phage tail-like protein
VLDVAHFTVFIGDQEMGFSSVSSLTSETDPADPERSGYRTVILRRALTGSSDLFRWRQAVADGKRDLRRVVIRQLDPAGERTVNAWQLTDAWPCRWSAPAFDASGEGLAMEELELAYERLEWLDGSEESDGGIA